MAINKAQQSALLTQLWTPDDAWQAPGNVTLSGVVAGNLVLSLGSWWDTVRGGGSAQAIPTDSNGTLSAGISPTLPGAAPAPGWPVSGQICRILSASSGNHVVTPPSLGVDGDGLFFAAEFSGGAAGTWSEVEVGSNIVLSGTPGAIDGVSVSTAGAALVGDLVVALCTTDGDPSAIGVGAPTGYTNEMLLTTTTTVNIAAGAGWMIATSDGAQTASWTWADDACQYGQALIAVFRFTPTDSTAPLLTSPGGAATASTTADVGATTNEGNGTLYAVVTTSATQPSVAQIKAGQDHTGAAAAWAGSVAVSSTGAKTLDATGLSPTIAYYAHLVHTDAAANDSNRVSSAAFTTFQRAAPTSDVAAGAWTTSSGTDLFAAIDETTPSDADYIKTGTAADVCTVALGTLSDPAVSTDHKVSYRIGGDGTSGIQVALMQGTTVIASWTHDPAPASATTYVQTLTGTQADAITDYTALRLRFTEI